MKVFDIISNSINRLFGVAWPVPSFAFLNKLVGILEKLPNELILKIAEFLHPGSPVHMFLIELPRKIGARDALIHGVFLKRIAVQTENNQNLSENILEQLFDRGYYLLMAILIGSPRKMKDAAGRVFKSISAYGYVFWAGDRRMHDMLLGYIKRMSEKGVDIRQNLEEQRASMRDVGTSFTFKGAFFSGSKFFDLQLLVAAQQKVLSAFLAFAPLCSLQSDTFFFECLNREVDLRVALKSLRDVFSQVPTHVAQEYCGRLDLHESPRLKRTAIFYRVNESYMRKLPLFKNTFAFDISDISDILITQDIVVAHFVEKSWFADLSLEDGFFMRRQVRRDMKRIWMMDWPRFSSAFSMINRDAQKAIGSELACDLKFTQELSKSFDDFRRQLS